MAALTIVFPVSATALDLSAPPSITIFFESDRHLADDGIHFGDQITDPLDYINFGAVEATPGMLRQLLTGGYKSNLPLHKFTSFDELATAARSPKPTTKVVVFVHGCCTNFQLAATQAASLAQCTGATVLMYDWASPLASYGGSLLTYPRSQERFNKFMLDVAKAFPDEDLSVVSFSMGNQLLDNFLLQYKNSDVGRQFDQLVFGRADTDAVAFRSHIARITPHAKHTFVYASNNDAPLLLSDALRKVASPSEHGARLGDTRSHLRPEESLTVLDVSPLKMNHSIPYSVIAEFLSSNGEIPASSATYSYTRLNNGVVRVKDSH
jgi:hypothetical protein